MRTTDICFRFFCFLGGGERIISAHKLMAKEHQYKFCFGPWNISEGSDPYGPTTRPAQTFKWKLAQLRKHGFEAMMFHDDDAVPDIDAKSNGQIQKEARQLKRRLDNEGIMTALTPATSRSAASMPSTVRCAASTSPTFSART